MTTSDHKQNRRILIMDDNRAIHDDFRKILSPGTVAAAALDVAEAQLFGQPANAVPKIQYEIDSAYQGQEGVLLVQEALAAGRPYAVAFVDIRMPPGMDGVAATQKIWEMDPEIQIVLCTAYADYSWDELFEKIGNHDGLVILKKPFDTVEALQLAHALTQKWWLHQQAKEKMEELERLVAGRTQELAKSLSLLKATFESMADGIVAVDLSGQVISYNPKFAAVWQFPAAMLACRDAAAMRAHIAGQVKDPAAFLWQVKAREADPEAEGFDVIELKNGHTFERYVFPQRINGERVGEVISWRDITASKRLQVQLIQSQKLETVGKLAGGVAHEFNSILTAIIMQSELLLTELAPGSSSAESAVEITKSAERAAALTRQLLAYGRKQFLRPETLDLNVILMGMEATLRHVLGRNVDLRLVPAAGLRPVHADVGQIEQVIMNLVLNAHEAMPNGGKLTLETANLTFGPDSAGHDPELKPGDYVLLALTDNGCGMTEEVKARIFEPFFTTKSIGQGTGLGLSTCYGIVKQSGGHISLYTEPGRGTTFKIYLPQVPAALPLAAAPPVVPSLPRGTETILLVEDDLALRDVAASSLKRLGYRVWAAADGIEALRLQAEHSDHPIDLLLTDVVMPQMSGRELADRIRAIAPRTKLLFASGYTENAIVHQGVLDKGVVLLPKPFTPAALANKVREVLDQPANGPAAGT